MSRRRISESLITPMGRHLTGVLGFRQPLNAYVLLLYQVEGCHHIVGRGTEVKAVNVYPTSTIEARS